MLKLELLALATKSCNFYPCQKYLSSCIIDQVCCSHGKSLIRKLHHWQKVKRSLLRVCKEESQERSGEDTVVKKWVLLSASQFRNSWKLPRCQPLSSHSYRNKPLTVPYYSPRHWSSSQKSGAFIRKFLLVACKFQKMCSKSHFPEQSRKINSRDSTSQKPQDSKNLQKFCHARDFWEQDIFWLFNTTILPLSYNQKGWMPLNTGKFNCCWNLGNQNAPHHT